MMRSCLEYAGYALAIFKDPALESFFTNRHVSQADMTAQKTAFRISEIKKAIESFDSKLAELFQMPVRRGRDRPDGTLTTRLAARHRRSPRARARRIRGNA
jgi:hypothetical protein